MKHDFSVKATTPQKDLPLLAQISKPPTQIFYRGKLPPPEASCVAVVGARDATSYGIEMAWEIGRDLAANGVWVVSGLAKGIDTAAHEGALSAGKTVAVVAHGLDRIYPEQNRELANEILRSGGGIVSEFPLKSGIQKFHFPMRNRIIAGLACAVIVVQAAERSGSLITANFAAEFGREVFVASAPFGEKAFSGGVRLVNQGAKLMNRLEDLIEETNEAHLS